MNKLDPRNMKAGGIYISGNLMSKFGALKANDLIGAMEEMEHAPHCACIGLSCCPIPHIYMRNKDCTVKLNAWVNAAGDGFEFGDDEAMQDFCDTQLAGGKEKKAEEVTEKK